LQSRKTPAFGSARCRRSGAADDRLGEPDLPKRAALQEVEHGDVEYRLRRDDWLGQS
jgi:hypothetical protein